MPPATLADVLRYLRKNCAVQVHRDLADRELLARYLAEREDDAFAVLMHRHGRMVFGICKRLLADSHAAEDCFQATFLVLAQKAATIRKTASLASWLYGVAQRIASKARAQTASRRQRERQISNMAHAETPDDLTWQELRAVLDEEVARLPEKHRAPIVLCYFEGKTHYQAAQELGLAKRTLTNHVTRGLELLRKHLTRRGVALPAGVLALTLSEKALAAPVGAMLAINTAKAVTSVMAGMSVPAGCVSARAIALAEEAMVGLMSFKAKIVVVVMALGLTVGGAGVAGFGGFAAKQQPAKPTKAQLPAPNAKAPSPQKKLPPIPTDLYGDPLPEGALARLGTMRFRHANLGAIAYSPDGTILASIGGNSFGLCLLDAATGRLLHRLAFPPDGLSLAFSPDSKSLFVGAFQSELALIDVVTGKELRHFGKIDNNVPHVAFAPDGMTAAVSQRVKDGAKVTLFDVATGQEKRTLEWVCEEQPNTVISPPVAFSPDGKIMASGSPDKTVRLWEVSTGKELRALAGHENEVWWVAFSKDGKTVVSSGSGGAIRVWDAKTGKLLWTFRDEQGPAREFAFSPNGKILAAAFYDGTLRLLDPEAGKELRSAKTNIPFWYLAFSPDGKVLACPRGSAIHLFDAGTLQEIGPITGHTDRVTHLRFTTDGQALFSVGRDRKFLEWDLATLQKHRTLFTDVSGSTDLRSSWNAVDISPSGKVMALVRRLPGNKAEDAVHLYDCGTGKELFALHGHKEWPDFVLFSPDGNVLASTGKDGISLWEVATGNQLHFLPEQLSSNETVAFSHDGKLLIFANPDGTIQVRDVATAKEKRRWPSEQKRTRGLAFSADAKHVASASYTDVQVWEAESGKRILNIAGLNRASSVAFSPSGRILALGEWEEINKNGDKALTGRITMWEVISGQKLRSIDMQQGTHWSLAFAPDSRTLATGGDDSTILLWDLTGQREAAKVEAAPLTAKDLASLWSDLADSAPKADRAIWTLVFAPKQSLPYLKERLRPIALADQQQVAKLAADLDHENFALRQKAAKALDDLGEAAEAALRKAVAGNIPLEVRQRIEQILEKRDRDALRKLRGVETLEQIGTAEAKQVLEEMATGSPNPRVGEAAAAALKRLGSRGL